MNANSTKILTRKELELIFDIVATQIEWREGGCLNDGDKVDKRRMKQAEKIVGKLQLILSK